MEFRQENNRIYAEDSNGRLIAEVTFPESSPGVATITHTFVSPDLRGKGIADALIRAAVRQIEKNGQQPAATCPYAIRWFENHPEYLKTHNPRR